MGVRAEVGVRSGEEECGPRRKQLRNETKKAMSAMARGVWAAQAGHLQVGGKQNAVGKVLNASKPIKTLVARKVTRRARREARARVQCRQQRVLAGGAVRAEAHGQVAVGRAVGPGGAHLRKI